jgi:hypothetical protein
MTILEYPVKECGACGGTTWWYSTIEKSYKGLPAWVCGICSPPPSDLGRIIMRVIKGNYVLSQRRQQINDLPDETPEEKAIVLAEREAWGEGVKKMSQLGVELKKLTGDCLYIEGSKKIKPCIHNNDIIECFCCPNEYWWRQELEDLWFGKLKETP